MDKRKNFVLSTIVGAIAPADQKVWPLKLAGASKFAMGQKRVENFLRVLAAAIASYIQIDKHLDNLQSEFDAQRSKSDSPNKRKPSASDVALGRSSSGIADKIMWAMKCLHRLSKVQEVVQLMLGQAYKAGAALNGGSDAGSGLRNCSGAATELEKEVEAYRKEMFDAWES
ncbi:cytoplasmic dynein heavy chain 1b [Haematococcus lacustris]|uniref:Cytoplasmic dynein heavy chain 1b n=1 Tax=Haematococcus lacustris TaxID=44745 RepID=A0A699YNM9_HAELA|nr:cytoplasmic dynein heavy chain 1b [Haematococcus lacustris]